MTAKSFDPRALRFDGKSGRKPTAEARRYVYRVLAAVIETESRDREGWFFGGIENECDQRRLRKVLPLVGAEMMRKGST